MILKLTAILNYDPARDGTFAAHDHFTKIIGESRTFIGAALYEYQCGYDYNGNRNYRAYTQSTAKSEFYSYDALNRVTDRQQGTLNGGDTGISGTPTWEEQYGLDELGNWPGYLTKTSGTTDLTQTRTHSAVNETTGITGGSWVTPAYDNSGNMTQGSKPGSETTTLNFVYDAWNRMVKVEDGSSTVIAYYSYDGQNHRVRKRLSDGLGGYAYGFDYYYNESWQTLEETETIPSGGGHTFTYAQYVWGARYIDAPVVRFRNTTLNTSGTGDETLYYTNDANMNVTALFNPATGAVVERYTYDTYGRVHIWADNWTTSRSNSSYDNQILFGGYRFDPESGLYHVRNRMYHPTLGRWMQRDIFAGSYVDGMNLLQYVLSNPLRYRDDFGLLTQSTAEDVVTNFLVTFMPRIFLDYDADDCIHNALARLGNSKTVEELGVIGRGLIFGSLDKALPESVLAHIGAGIVEKPADVAAKGDVNGDDVIDASIGAVAKELTPDELTNLTQVLTNLSKTAVGKAQGPARLVSVEGKSNVPDVRFDDSCEFIVTAKTSIGFFGGESYTEFTITGKCDYKCNKKPPQCCVCGSGTYTVAVWGTYGGMGGGVTLKAAKYQMTKHTK